VAVFAEEWDKYLRTGPANKSVGSFMSSKALGATQQAAREGVALVTGHSSKGLEFDVVFCRRNGGRCLPGLSGQDKEGAGAMLPT